MLTTEIILQINRPGDLSLLISFLEKSGIAFQQRTKNSTPAKRSTGAAKQSQNAATLEKYIGSMPNLNVEDFEKYHHQTRNEWERDTF